MSILAAHMSRSRVVVGVDTVMQVGSDDLRWNASKLFTIPAAGCVIGGVGSVDVIIDCFLQSFTRSFEEIADSFCDITGAAWSRVAAGAKSNPFARQQPFPAMTYLAGWDARCGAMRAFRCQVNWDDSTDFQEIGTQAFFTPSCGTDAVPLYSDGDPIELVRQTAALQVQHGAAGQGPFALGGRLIVADLREPTAGQPTLSIFDLGEIEGTALFASGRRQGQDPGRAGPEVPRALT